MKICSIENCDRKHIAKGFCQSHYDMSRKGLYKCKEDGCKGFMSSGEYCSKHKKCTVEGCTVTKYYAKGYCRKHYACYVTNKDSPRQGSPCKSKICNKTTFSDREYCSRCQSKVNKGLDPNIKNKRGFPSKGLADYKDHYAMKQARLRKLEEVGCKCEHCDKQKPKGQLEMHHIDGSKDNHAYENFLLLCKKCHGIIHRKKFNGLTMQEISKIVQCGYTTVAQHITKKQLSKKFGSKIDELINP